MRRKAQQILLHGGKAKEKGFKPWVLHHLLINCINRCLTNGMLAFAFLRLESLELARLIPGQAVRGFPICENPHAAG